MATYRVLRIDEPLLRRKAKKVKQFDDQLKALVEDMLETMVAANGMGLAATQIGVPQRVIVIQLPAESEGDEPGKVYILVNPAIVEQSEERAADDEGCLSVPGIVGEVSRPLKVTVRGQSVKGRPLRLCAEGLLARVFQHEIDHLDGVLFVDRVAGPEKLRRVIGEGESQPVSPAVSA